MFHPPYDFAILGGDQRQIYMANKLTDLGYSIITYGLNHSNLNSCCYATSLDQALSSSLCIVIPIPCTQDKIHLTAQITESDLTITNLCQHLHSQHTLFGGCFTEEIIEHCHAHNISFIDCMSQESVLLFNTIATAEGAIAEALIESPINLHQSNCLIIGFGRCGKTLGLKLNNLCHTITVATDLLELQSMAQIFSLDSILIHELSETIEKFDIIFNTIPSIILTKELLIRTKKDVLIIDIASYPGGVDYQYAKSIARTAKLCQGLPGKYSPKSSATFLTNYLLNYIGKK